MDATKEARIDQMVGLLKDRGYRRVLFTSPKRERERERERERGREKAERKKEKQNHGRSNEILSPG